MCESICVRIESVRDNGPYSHFRGGLGVVWVRDVSLLFLLLLNALPQVDRGIDYEHKGDRN